MDRQSEGEPGADRVIDDTFRIQLMEEHLVQLHRAIADGANCFGVHQWTFIDNWSWINASNGATASGDWIWRPASDR